MLFAGLPLSLALCWSKPSVTLVSSLPSPQRVGTVITLEARPTVDGDPDKQTRFLQYRFTVSADGGPFRILSDFSRSEGALAQDVEDLAHDAILSTIRAGEITLSLYMRFDGWSTSFV
jgi:hypothetical protein